MLNFPDAVLQGIDMLRGEIGSNRKNLLIVSYPFLEIIVINRALGGEREISLKLFYDLKSNSFEIQAPTYKYYSKISHYDYNRSERRWLRNKDFIFRIIRNLKASGLWDFVSNKDFIIVNEYNKNSNHRQLLKDLRMIEEL